MFSLAPIALLARTAKVVRARSTLLHPNTTIQPTTLQKRTNTVDATLTVSPAAAPSTADLNTMIPRTAPLKKISMDRTMAAMAHHTITTILADQSAVVALDQSKILK
jgi:hypothetical protein